MTVFSEQERAMMWGIYGELEIMNRNLANLVGLLENQGQAVEKNSRLLAEISAASPKCVEQSCPNPPHTKSGRCHYHRYLG